MKWEYKVVYIDTARWTSTGLPGDVNEQFDKWGADGWELVRTESVLHSGWGWGTYTAGIIAFFKRPVAA